MLAALIAIPIGYGIGSIPVAYLAGRWAGGIDIREHGSGNVGASNVWQTVSKGLVVPVGLAQIAQGFAAVVIARALGAGEGVQAASGAAAVIACDWNPWLRFTGGRGIGASIGVLLAMSWFALGAFVVVALAGVALRAIPQGVGIALIAAPVAAIIAGDAAPVVAGCVALAALAALKRVLANGPPAPELARPGVWWIRLALDRDIRDREAWVRRRTETGP